MYEYLFFPLLNSIQESHFLVMKVASLMVQQHGKNTDELDLPNTFKPIKVNNVIDFWHITTGKVNPYLKFGTV